MRTDSIHYVDLPELVSGHFALDELEDVDHFSSDVRTCTFLVRDGSGMYTFAHPSFLDFFCATLFAGIEEISESIDIDLQGRSSVAELHDRSPLIVSFMGDLIRCPLEPTLWVEINEVLTQEPNTLSTYEDIGLDLDPADDRDYEVSEGDFLLDWVSQMAEGTLTIDEIRSLRPRLRRLYSQIVGLLEHPTLDSGIKSKLSRLLESRNSE